MTDSRIPTSASTTAYSTDETGVEPKKVDEGLKSKSNPAQEGYYRSEQNKNNAIAFAIWIALTLFGLFLTGMGFYFVSLREPIIRLEERFDNLKNQMEQNTSAIELLKDSIRSIPEKQQIQSDQQDKKIKLPN